MRERQSVAPIEARDQPRGRQDATDHRAELIAPELEAGEHRLKLADRPLAEGLLVRRALLAAIGEAVASEVQDRVLAPGLAEDRDPSRAEDTPQSLAGD